MKDQIKKNKDMKKDEEKLKGQEVKEFFFFNWDSLHARLNSHYEAWSYKKGSTKKDYRIQKICLERTYS